MILRYLDSARVDLPVGATFTTDFHKGGATFQIAKRPLDGFGGDSLCSRCAFNRSKHGVNSFANVVCCGRIICNGERRADGRSVIVVNYKESEK